MSEKKRFWDQQGLSCCFTWTGKVIPIFKYLYVKAFEKIHSVIEYSNPDIINKNNNFLKSYFSNGFVQKIIFRFSHAHEEIGYWRQTSRLFDAFSKNIDFCIALMQVCLIAILTPFK